MVTNKERIALRRKARSADQVEADRATDRKRMADRRKARAANPAMVTNKERIALRRKARSADQVEADRATDRKRMADRRKARAANQVEADRANQKKRMAVYRKARAAHQVEADRATNKKRMAVQRKARAADQVDNNGKDQAGGSYNYNHHVDAGPSEYELRRLENISRNEARLRELGLGGKGPSMTRASNYNKKKSRSAKPKVAKETPAPAIPTRRSTRRTPGQLNIDDGFCSNLQQDRKDEACAFVKVLSPP
jgi:hypothetical protein